MVVRFLLSFLLGPALLAQVSSCLISGRCVDLEGAPIADASVGVPGGAAVRTAADGRFALELAVQDGLAFDVRQVFVAAAGRVSYRLPVEPILVGARAVGVVGREEVELGDVRLPVAVTFRGRVRDAAGAPLAGVRVTAFDELSSHTAWSAGWGGICTTDGSGRFTLAGVFDKGMRIEFEAAGHFHAVVRGAGIGTPLDVQLQPSGFVQGALPRRGDEPFEGWIYLLSEFPGARGNRLAARGDRFAISVASRGRFRVIGIDSQGKARWQSEVLTGPTKDVVLHPITAGEGGMRLRVVDADSGDAVGAARVAVRWFERDLPAFLRRHLIRDMNSAEPTAAPRVKAPKSTLRKGFVAVTAAGYAPALASIEFEAGGTIEVQLRVGGVLSGRVVGPRGAPIRDCLVECESKNGDSMAGRFAVRTTADGTFLLRGLAREKYVVQAANSPLSPMVSRLCDLTDQPNVADLKIELPPGVTVAGKIEGVPIGAGYRVILSAASRDKRQRSWESSVRHPDPWNLAGVASAPLAADGTFAIAGCGAGTRRLELFVPPPPRGGAPIRVPLQSVRIGDAAVQLLVDAAGKRPGVVAGVVQIEGAAVPAGRLAVLVRPPTDKEGRPRADAGSLRWQLVGGDGTFSIPLPPGPHRLQVIDCVTGIVLLRPVDEVAIDIEAGKTVAQNLEVGVVAAEVSFSMPTAGPTLVDHLQVRTGRMRAGGFATESIPFGGGTYGYPGVYLEGRPGPARFFVAPGPVRLEVGGATRLDAGSIHFGNDRGSKTVDANAGEPLMVELELGAPADLQKAR